jgi:hypothetical protein
VTDPSPTDGTHDIECPHCHRHFSSPLLTGTSARHVGFKCPHCKLFVAFERTGGPSESAG